MSKKIIIRYVLTALLSVFLLSGCSGEKAADSVSDNSVTEISDNGALMSSSALNAYNETVNEQANSFIDISAMEGDLAYATLCNIAQDPSGYIGDTIKITGIYKTAVSDPYLYHFCFLTSADGKERGIEFFMPDGATVAVDEEITIQGVLRIYSEETDGESSEYVRLEDVEIF